MLALDSLDAGLALSRLQELDQGVSQGWDPERTLARVYNDLHPGQRAFLDDTSTKILGICAGYRAGKTFALCAKAFHLAYLNKGHRGCVMEPTGPMIRDIWINDFTQFLDEYEIPYTYSTPALPQYVIHFPGADTKILCRSFENWQRLVGTTLSWILADEADTVKKAIADKAFPKVLARISAGNVRQFGVVSTPEGFGWMWSTFASEEAEGKEDRRLLRMKTKDNPHLPADYLQTLLTNYPRNLIAAYTEGEFMNLTSGQVYDRFSRDTHVREFPEPEHDEKLLLGVDFNIGNCNAVVCVVRVDPPSPEDRQRMIRQPGYVPQRRKRLYVWDELTGQHDTDALGQEAVRRYPTHTIQGYPDASGAKRTTNSTRSDVAILQSYGIGNYSPQANPPVRDRVNSVQALLENGDGDVRLFVHPRCKRLIECLEQQAYDEKGEPDKTAGFDHLCFAGNTLVATPSGIVPISSLPPSGLIAGPFGGWVRYSNAGMTGRDRYLCAVQLSDGSTVECTPEHQWLTESGQWIQAKHLRSGIRLASQRWPALRSSSFRARLTTCAATTFNAMAAACIALSGKPATGRSLTASISITLTATAVTTTRATSLLSRLANTLPTTFRRTAKNTWRGGMAALWSWPWQEQPSGMGVRRAGSGTLGTTNRCEKACTSGGADFDPVKCAAQSLRRCEVQTSSAAATARPKPAGVQALTTCSVTAPSVARRSPSTATRGTDAAPEAAALRFPISIVAVRITGTADVYCLRSETGSFALACGPVVSNCDSLGYVCHRIFAVGKPIAGPVRSVRVY